MTTNETPRPRPLLKWLRIGITAAGLLVCLPMSALWVRSYFYLDWYERPIAANRTILVISLGGRLRIATDTLIRSTVLFNDASGWRSLRVHSTSELYDSATEPATSVVGFTFNSIDYWTLWLPHWLLAVIGGASAGLPWVRRRYSLRTLLVVMTLVALVLGVIATLHQ